MELVILFLAAFAGGIWGGLKAFDALRAWRFNRRMAQARAVAEAYEIGKRFAMGSYAHGVTYIVRPTPDRPASDPYMISVKQEIEQLIRGQA